MEYKVYTKYNRKNIETIWKIIYTINKIPVRMAVCRVPQLTDFICTSFSKSTSFGRQHTVSISLKGRTLPCTSAHGNPNCPLSFHPQIYKSPLSGK